MQKYNCYPMYLHNLLPKNEWDQDESTGNEKEKVLKIDSINCIRAWEEIYYFIFILPIHPILAPGFSKLLIDR